MVRLHFTSLRSRMGESGTSNWHPHGLSGASSLPRSRTNQQVQIEVLPYLYRPEKNRPEHNYTTLALSSTWHRRLNLEAAN